MIDVHGSAVRVEVMLHMYIRPREIEICRDDEVLQRTIVLHEPARDEVPVHREGINGRPVPYAAIVI